MEYIFRVYSNIGLDKFDKIFKNIADITILTITFINQKEQDKNLLFLSNKIKAVNNTFVVCVIDFEVAKIKECLIYEGSNFTKLNCSFLKGFILKEDIAFVFGDNIYSKKFIEYLKQKSIKICIHVDIFGEGFMGKSNKKFDIVSTNRNCVKKIKKSRQI